MSQLISYYVRKTSTEPDGYMERMYSADKVDATIADLTAKFASLEAELSILQGAHHEAVELIAAADGGQP